MTPERKATALFVAEVVGFHVLLPAAVVLLICLIAELGGIETVALTSLALGTSRWHVDKVIRKHRANTDTTGENR